MYEDLVKRLRESKNEQCYIGCFGICDDCRIDAELKQAADTIEELSREYESIEKSLNKSVELVSKLQNPRWVSVTEQLPDAYKEVLLHFPHNQAVGFCDRDGCWAVYSGDGFYTEVADNEQKPTHWMKKFQELPKEE